MTDQPVDRNGRTVDRLPDVRPSRHEASYSAFGGRHLGLGSRPVGLPVPFDEPAWWEQEAVVSLPDARRWRAGSIISAHLPDPLRSALDREDSRTATRSSVWSFDDEPDRVLGRNRLGPEDVIPVLSSDEIARERSSWRDEAGRSTGKRGKRPKPGRKDRRGNGSGGKQDRAW